MRPTWTPALASPRAPLLAALVGVALCAPALGAGWLADDYLHRAKIVGCPSHPASDAPLAELFVFIPGTPAGNAATMEAGFIPWWSAPDLRAAFYRPLSAATHVLDHALWPDTAWAMHLHSLAWLALTIVVCGALYRRLGMAPLAAGLATLLFAVEDAHATPATWIANRNALIATVAVAVALGLHDRWRRGGANWACLLAPPAFLAGLLASELAVGLLGYLVAYALFLDPGSRPRRWAALVPCAAVAVGWWLAWRAAGYGTAGSEMYVDPGADVGGFTLAMIQRVPVLLLAQWTQLPADPWAFLRPFGQWAWAGIGAVVVLLLVSALWPVLRASARARFWAAGSLLCLPPVCASFPMDRLLVLAGVGAAALLGEAAVHVGWPGGVGAGQRRLRRLVTVLLLLHLPLAAALVPVRCVGQRWLFGVFALAAEQLPDDPGLEERRLVMVNGVEFCGLAQLARCLDGRPAPAAVQWLGHVQMDLDVSRAGPRALTLTPRDGFLSTPGQQLCRAPRYPFGVGDRIPVGEVVAEVDAVTRDGRPAAVTFHFQVELEDPSLLWMAWERGRLVPFEPPVDDERVQLSPTMPGVPWL